MRYAAGVQMTTAAEETTDESRTVLRRFVPKSYGASGIELDPFRSKAKDMVLRNDSLQ